MKPPIENVSKSTGPFPVFAGYIRNRNNKFLLMQSFAPRGFYLPSIFIPIDVPTLNVTPDPSAPVTRAFHTLTGLHLTLTEIYNPNAPVIDRTKKQAVTYGALTAVAGRRKPDGNLFWVKPVCALEMLTRAVGGAPPYALNALREYLPTRGKDRWRIRLEASPKRR